MIDNIIVASYLFAVLLVGYFKSRKIRDMREYSIADRTYSLPIMVTTMTATVIGSGSTFGFISSVYVGGILYILISMGNPICRLITAQFLINKIERFSDCISVGDIMDRFYGRYGRVVSGIAGALYCAANVGGQVSAIGFIVHYFLNIPYGVGVFLGCGAVILYSTVGGVKAVTATDVVQFAVLIIAIPMVCNVGISAVGGFSGLVEKIPASHFAMPDTPSSIVSYFFMFLSFTIPFLDPSHSQRILMAKNTKQIRNTLRCSAAIEFPFFLTVGLIGLVAVATNPGLEQNLAFPHVVNTILPVGLKGLAVAGLLAIVMSSADSFLNAAGITLVHDTIKPLFGRAVANEESELRLTKIATFVLGTSATIVALYFDSIMAIMLFSFNFWCPIMVVPLYAALIGIKPLRPRHFIVSSTCGFVAFLAWNYLVEPHLGISALIPSMVANLLGFTLTHLWSRARNRLSHSEDFSVGLTS